jgi:endonuclease/exonuclease/phosphatase family metal-dependent hydrolase
MIAKNNFRKPTTSGSLAPLAGRGDRLFNSEIISGNRFFRFHKIQRVRSALLLFCLLLASVAPAQVLRVATFNLENYIEDPGAARPLKTPAARAKICQSILALKPDIIALEEMGSTNALIELQSTLKNAGLNLPFWDHLSASDPNIHLAVLSRFPIIARHPHTNESFLLDGRRMFVSRGFLDDEIQINPQQKLALISAHLKSKLVSEIADEQEWRDQEAAVLRRIVDAQLAAHPAEPLVVLGDFNDTKDSRAVKNILGKGKTALFDLRPVERASDHSTPDDISWTEHFAKEDIYSRIDYIFVNNILQREFLPNETYILNLPDWNIASDHRPLVAGFKMDP